MEKWLWVACKLSQLLSLTATSLPMVKATASAVHIPMPQGIPPDSRQCSEFPQLWSCVSSSNPEALTKIPLQVFPLLDAYVPAFSFGVSLNTHFRTCTSVPLPLSWRHIPHCQKLSQVSRSSDLNLAQVFHQHVRRNWIPHSVRSWMTRKQVDRKPHRPCRECGKV